MALAGGDANAPLVQFARQGGGVGGRLVAVIDHWAEVYSQRPRQVLYIGTGGIAIRGGVSGGFAGGAGYSLIADYWDRRKSRQPARADSDADGEPAEAEEVAQEVFVAVFKAIPRFRGDSRLSTWIYRIATNHGKNRIKYLARRARDARRPLDDNTQGSDTVIATGSRPDPPDHRL